MAFVCKFIVTIFSCQFLLHCGVLSANPTVWGQYPGVVSIGVSSQNIPCVGHILDGLHIVTSAQCVLNENSTTLTQIFWFKITAGDIKLLEPTEYRIERNVTNIFLHDQYNPETKENDIAILRFDASLPLPHNTIEPVILNSRIVKTSSSCDFVGWKIDQEKQSEQQLATMLIYDRDFCNSQQYPGLIFESVLCGQLQIADSLTINNIGGGLYCNGKLTGLLTIPQTGTSTPSVFTQLRFYLKWIKSQINSIKVPGRILSPVYKTS